MAAVLAAGFAVLLLAAPGPAGRGAAAASPGAVNGRVKSGTGFFVAPAGFVVTSRHIVAGCPGVLVWAGNGLVRSARVVASDAALDLALLSVPGGTRKAPVPYYRDGLRSGERIATIGFGVLPRNPEKAVMTRGTFVGRRATPDGRDILLIRADLRPGNSGGPVIDRYGALVGMVIGRLAERRDLGVLIATREINGFLSREGVRRLPIGALPSADENPGGVLAGMSVLVQCTAAPRAG